MSSSSPDTFIVDVEGLDASDGDSTSLSPPQSLNSSISSSISLPPSYQSVFFMEGKDSRASSTDPSSIYYPHAKLDGDRSLACSVPTEPGQWRMKLFECFLDDSLCSAMLWFNWCFLVRLSRRMEMSDCFECSVALFGWLPIVNGCFLAVLRSKLRHRQGIGGQCFLDLLESLACPCCVLVQSLVEVGGVRITTGLS